MTTVHGPSEQDRDTAAVIVSRLPSKSDRDSRKAAREAIAQAIADERARILRCISEHAWEIPHVDILIGEVIVP